MQINRFSRVQVLLSIFVAIASSQALSQKTGESVIVDEPSYEDIYLAGRYIDILADLDEDLVAAGQRITINNSVGGDATIAGEILSIHNVIFDDLRAAGRTISLTSEVRGHMVAAGQNIRIGADAQVNEWAWLAGETVEIHGSVQGELKVAADTILIDGEVVGDVELIAEEIRIGPEARILGDLRWRSPNPLDQSESARIDGQIIELELPEDWQDFQEGGAGSFFFKVFSLALGAFVLYLLLPKYSVGVAKLLQTDIWKCLGIGLAILIITPIASLLLLVTGVGYLLGLILLAAYFLVLILGLLMAMVSLSQLVLSKIGKDQEANNWVRAVAILAVVFVVVAVGAVPVIGGLFFFILWMFGLGSINLGQFRSGRRVGETELQNS
jgi:cytoskeletal protein CcmA (bactofilin family)